MRSAIIVLTVLLHVIPAQTPLFAQDGTGPSYGLDVESAAVVSSYSYGGLVAAEVERGSAAG